MTMYLFFLFSNSNVMYGTGPTFIKSRKPYMVFVVSRFCPNWDRVSKLTGTHQGAQSQSQTGNHHGLFQPCVLKASHQWPSLTFYKEEIIPHFLILRSLILAQTSEIVLSLTPIHFELSWLTPTNVLVLSQDWDWCNISGRKHITTFPFACSLFVLFPFACSLLGIKTPRTLLFIYFEPSIWKLPSRAF